MALSLCPDVERAIIGVLAAALVLWSSSSLTQLATILLGAILGLWLCRTQPLLTAGALGVPVSRLAGIVSLGVFAVLLAGVPLLAGLPLLRDAVVAPGWLSDSTFLAGYGAAQGVPGPLFTFAAYLGAIAAPAPHRVLGAVIALVAAGGVSGIALYLLHR
jgi:chromate transporter